MKHGPSLVTAHGARVWSNVEMDALRQTECLCLNCAAISTCDYAKAFYHLCKIGDMAFMMTRCIRYTEPE